MDRNKIILILAVLGAFFALPVLASSTDGGIDTVYKYVWGENIGWLNFGTSEGNVRVNDVQLTGYVWGENIGWVSLSCANTSSCSSVEYRVANDGYGNLSGYAWSENVGWINFAPTYGGVTINSSGDFSGYAWGENTGWLVFNCATTNSCASVNYKLKTDWQSRSSRPQCNNAIDDDSDGKIDYPADPGCASLDDDNETDGGGGGPAGSYSPPVQPSGGFSVLINSDAEETNSLDVVLGLKGGSDTARMAISNHSDFEGASQENYQAAKNWNLCRGLENSDNPICNSSLGLQVSSYKFQVFVKFFTQAGYASEIVSDIIIYQKESGLGELTAQISLPFVTPPTEGPKKPLIEYLPEILRPLVPEFLKPGEPAPPEIPLEEQIPKEAPMVFSGQWNLLPLEKIGAFVLAPLPENIKILAHKFPQLEEKLKEIGVVRTSDIEKLKTVKLSLPGLTEAVGVRKTGIGAGEFAIIKGIPISQLSVEVKKDFPQEIVFAKTGGELIDFNIGLNLDPEGKFEQKINVIVKKPLSLIVKPEGPVKSVRGYLVFKSKNRRADLLPLLLGSIAESVLVDKLSYPQEEPVRTEEKLVLMEFEYLDGDGDGIYTAEIEAPAVEGEYEIITVMDYLDLALGPKAIRLITVVDPEGYVFEKIGDKELRVPGAVVSLFYLNPQSKHYELWPAKEYYQENPQITDVTGKYSFLVPEGSYYLKVEAPSYSVYEGKSFIVKEGSGIHFNIELKSKNWFWKAIDWKLALLIAVIILLLYNFYRDRMRNRSKN